MKKINKIFLRGILPLTASTSIVSVATSCANEDITKYKLLPTYTAQADQLIALGIKPDYYPLQLDANGVFSYITNPKKFMFGQSDDFKEKFAKKIQTLIPNSKGTSWWNQQALLAEEKGSDPEYWTHIGGDLVMYEHYLLDDGAKAIDASTAPKHFNNPRTFMETNFRQSRDPFTRLPKEIIEALLDKDGPNGYSHASAQVKEIVKVLLDVARKIEGEDPEHNAVDGKPMPKGIPQREANDEESWIYNDFVFARNYHEDFLDNDEFNNSHIVDWLVNKDGLNSQWVFDKDPVSNLAIQKLFYNSTYQDTEALIKKYVLSKTHSTRHHPIMEVQEEIGGAPMFEGAQRDNMLYFYNTASKLSDAFTKPSDNSPQYIKDGYNHLIETFHGKRLEHLKNARENAVKISDQMRERMSNVKKIVDKIKLSNKGKLVYGLFTLAPGQGQSTIQSSSKYSFIYNEMGFDQPLPSNLTSPLANISIPGANAQNNSLFNMDDNGWWWNMSDSNGIISKRISLFKNQIDLGVITANEINYNNLKEDELTEIASLFKGISKENISSIKVDYNLWNEGLKTPFAIHMIIDKILDQLLKKYKNVVNITDSEVEAAKNWGDYFTNEFIN